MAMPALLTSTLTGPSAASALSIAFPIEAVSVTSICTATARPPCPRISSSRLFSLAVWRAASTTAAPCADKTRANCRPSPCEAPVTRMISLLTSNKPGMTNSAKICQFIDTDDFHDRKPDSFTNIPTSNRRRIVVHEQFRCRGLCRIAGCSRPRLICRIAAQRGHDPGLSDRDADRGLGDVADLASDRWQIRLTLDAEFAAVLRNFSDRGHRARENDANGARRSHWTWNGYRRPPCRRGAWRGARRPCRNHAATDFRSVRGRRSAACI